MDFPVDCWSRGAGLALTYDEQTNPGIIVVVLVVIGLGVGSVLQPTLVALQAHSAKSRRAVIISNRNFNRCAGGACGLAVSAAVLQARLRATLPPEYAYLAASTYSLPRFEGGTPPAVLDAYMAASHAVFTMQVPLVGICFLCAMFIKDRGLAPKEESAAGRAIEEGNEKGQQSSATGDTGSSAQLSPRQGQDEPP